jgi:hypothetical protein
MKVILVNRLKWPFFFAGTEYEIAHSHTCSYCGAPVVAIVGFETRGGSVCTCGKELPTSHTWFSATMFKEK